MTLTFILSMPGNNAWNGRWSGQGNLYAIVKTFTGKKATAKAEAILAGRYYSHNFGDGWRAGIEVRSVDSAEARKLRKDSRGFCGYDWMVANILDHGKASDLTDEEKALKYACPANLAAAIRREEMSA